MQSGICQVCSGNLGNNIFTQGDFGSGAIGVVQVDPGIAPGYVYTTTTPHDGQYSLTKHTSMLNGLFPTWIEVAAIGPDPNSYMMVVNASYEPGIFYEEIVDGLCENTLYEFSADVINIVRKEVGNHIKPNLDFLIDGNVVFSTGAIPQNEKWNKYGFSFTTNSVQTSLLLTLRNNAPGGSGNDLALDNISFRPCGPKSFIDLDASSNIFLCKDGSPFDIFADIEIEEGTIYTIQWQSSLDGINWTNMDGETNSKITHTNFDTGDYFYRYLSAGNSINILNPKCRIISDELTVTVLPEMYVVADTICSGNVFTFGATELYDKGVYVENFISSKGCDSIVELILESLPQPTFDIDFLAEDPTCFGYKDGSIILTNTSGGYGGLSSFILDANENIVTENFVAGEYYINVSDRYGCNESISVELENPVQVNVELPPDTTLRLGDEIFINPEIEPSGLATIWNGNGEIDCSDCPSINFKPFESTSVVLQVIDEYNCIGSDSMFIVLDENNLFYIPNVFSPNGDKVNDYFTISSYKNTISTIKSFSVFDRWGGLFHHSENIDLLNNSVVWDGYSNNTISPIGVYTYLIEGNFINGKVFVHYGDVMIMR